MTELRDSSGPSNTNSIQRMQVLVKEAGPLLSVELGDIMIR